MTDATGKVGVFVALCLMSAAAPAVAEDIITLDATGASTPANCLQVDAAAPRGPVTLKRTFHDDFKTLRFGRKSVWATHYAGTKSWPEALYSGGQHSDAKRRLAGNKEQQIYVDPTYRGLSNRPLNLDPFSNDKGHLTITATRTPGPLLSVLFDLPYTSGVIISKFSFSQLHGYFEIRAKVPFGDGVWPAFWLLQDEAWPPEIDVFEARGSRTGTLAMTTHWTDPQTGKHRACSRDVVVADAGTAFHTYGVLWTEDVIAYFIDRKVVYRMKTPPGLDKPMYMLANLAIGGAMAGVGPVTAATPPRVDYEIEWISAYK